MVAALFPHPALSVTVAVVWVLLANDVTAGSVLLAVLIGIAVPKFTSLYWPGRPRIRRPALVIEYMLIVLYDIVVSNIQVARLVLFRRGDSLRSRFVVVPIELRTPEAIFVLAATITMTPGTVTADVGADGRTLLVHCLEMLDEDDPVARIKARYERRLRRIFA
jgi:multicomponent K+:H+ antiporter subunit E